MIDLYYWPTPNGWKASIALEEMELAYRVVPVNIGRGDQFKPEFLRISPNNRMPAIVDHEPVGGGEPLAMFESGAIFLYLAEKSGRFLPRGARERYDVTQWVMWQIDLDQYRHLRRWYDALKERPALRRGFEVGRDIRGLGSGAGKGPDEQARKHLFGKTSPTGE